MFWFAAAAAFAGAFGQGMNERQQIKAQNRIKKANAEATNVTRAGNAQLASAVGNLQRWRQSVSNQRALKQAGMEQTAVKDNLMRMYKDSKSADMDIRLNAASQAGAAAAAFSAAGVGGGTRDMINSTLKVSEGRKLDQLKDQKDTYQYDALRSLTNMTEDMAYRLDDSMIIDQIDYRQAFANEQKVPSYFRVGMNSMMSAMGSSGGQAAMSNLFSGDGSGASNGSSSVPNNQFFAKGYGNSTGGQYRI